MSAQFEQIGDEGLGGLAGDRYLAASIEHCEALIEREPSLDRWVAPLNRAIKRRRLRLPSLSPTVHRVVRLIESADVDLDELAEAVAGDPALATRVMGVANSSYFRGATAVPNVREALMRMGVREARTIVVVVALRSTVLRSPGLGEAASAIWRHSLLAATATQEIAQELPPWETSGFLAGLVHDLGQLVVLAFASELPAWQEDGEEPSDDVVMRICAETHAPLGALVLASWGFPESFCDAIAHHHEPAGAAAGSQDLARAVDLGQRIAHGIDDGWPTDPEELDPAIVSAGETLGLDRDELAEIASESEAQFTALSKLT